ncbi:MAG: type III-B CRISPR module RAMP protein Cmr1, partial [Myxococcota bacterium]
MRTVAFETMVPMFGGGSASKRWDEDQVVRGPSIRGQLRHWWRATVDIADVDALRARERALFGGVFPGDGDDGAVASRVVIHATGTGRGVPQPKALDWAVRWVKDKGVPDTKQFCDVTDAVLTMRMPDEVAAEVDRALDAWRWLGGLGGRTRRG